MKFKLCLLAVVFLGAVLGVMQTQVQALPGVEVDNLLPSQSRFCASLDDKIEILNTLEDAARIFAQTQGNRSAVGFNEDICSESMDFYQHVCGARQDAEYYKLEYCNGSYTPSMCGTVVTCI